MTYTWPLGPDIPVSQAFGSNPSNGVNPAGGHTGTDFAAPVGTPVHAMADGVVKFADWASTLPPDYRADGSGPNPYWLNPSFGGIVVIIDHGPVVTVHAHLSETALTAGDTVKQGQEIAKTGNTGAATTGPHLHFETLPDGWNFQNGTYGRVDPARYCTAYWDTITNTPEGAATVATNQEKLDFLYSGWLEGGASTLYGASWQKLIDDIPRRGWATEVTRTAPDGTEVKVPALQELADTKTAVLAIQKQLAAAPAPASGPAALSQADIDAVAKAVVKALAAKLSA